MLNAIVLTLSQYYDIRSLVREAEMSQNPNAPPLKDPLPEPMTPIQARNQARWILEHGSVKYPDHALKRLVDHGMSQVDAINVIRAGVYQPPEIQNAQWRYRIHTKRFYVVIAFERADRLAVCTQGRFS